MQACVVCRGDTENMNYGWTVRQLADRPSGSDHRTGAALAGALCGRDVRPGTKIHGHVYAPICALDKRFLKIADVSRLEKPVCVVVTILSGNKMASLQEGASGRSAIRGVSRMWSRRQSWAPVKNSSPKSKCVDKHGPSTFRTRRVHVHSNGTHKISIQSFV